MSKTRLRILTVLFGLVLAIWGTVFQRASSRPSSASPAPSPTAVIDRGVTSTNAVVLRVVDGDTLKVLMDGTGEEATVRLLGINTPESVDPRRPVECFGREASAYHASLTVNHRVRLDEDHQADAIDKYGRLLRNVILDDGTDVNARLVRDGYALAYLSFPLNKFRKAELRRLELEARTEQRGLWNPKTCDGKK